MTKAISHDKAVRWAQHVTVHVAKSAALARLLAGAGPWTQRAGLASAATPGNGAQNTVSILSHHVGHVADELAQALQRAREAGDPGADELAAVAAHLGITEVQPAPAPEPGHGGY
jgi:hypothetical protein